MKRTVPLLITAISGLVLIAAFFIPAYQTWGEIAAVWFDVLASIAFVLGGGNLLKLHLKKVSDRQEGWGYSGITVVAFLLTLFFGLSKLGSRPSADAESYGYTAAPLAVTELPEYRVDGTIPVRTDGESLPVSTRRQIREENGQIVFRGWLRSNQHVDLSSYYDTLAWRCAVDRLNQTAQPPESIAKVQYDADQRILSYPGFVSEEEEQALRAELGNAPPMKQAIDKIVERGRASHSISVTHIPEDFDIPDTAEEYVKLSGDTLTIHGPMTVGLRENLSKNWCGYETTRPLPAEFNENLLSQLEGLGSPLAPAQKAAWDTFFAAEWTASQLILVVNAGGAELPGEKTACELEAELLAGETFLEKEVPAKESATLNAEQEQLITAFVAEPNQTTQTLKDKLVAAGELTVGQETALNDFFAKLPMVASQRQSLAFELLKTGPLSTAQQDFLLTDAAGQYAWEQQVGRLFIQSHQIRYPWSGDYSEQGSPFWWTYEYVFQPLLTTTFAMLAFYVASAAFRAFRAKNLEATLLLGTAFIILLGRTFAGAYMTNWIPDTFSAFKIDQMTIYIMSIFNTAGNRAIMIGIALGIASTSLKVLLGVDRSYLGSGED